MPFIFHAEQVVPRTIDEVFDFFSRAENLQKITPHWLNFGILSVEPEPIRKGTLIRYSLRWRIFPIRWTTEIIAWEPPNRFIDLQLKGPYKLWHHEHRFVAEGNSTRIIDEVTYKLPFGGIGRIAHRLKVSNDVETIFRYRKKAVEDLFGAAKEKIRPDNLSGFLHNNNLEADLHNLSVRSNQPSSLRTREINSPKAL